MSGSPDLRISGSLRTVRNLDAPSVRTTGHAVQWPPDMPGYRDLGTGRLYGCLVFGAGGVGPVVRISGRPAGGGVRAHVCPDAGLSGSVRTSGPRVHGTYRTTGHKVRGVRPAQQGARVFGYPDAGVAQAPGMPGPRGAWDTRACGMAGSRGHPDTMAGGGSRTPTIAKGPLDGPPPSSGFDTGGNMN